MNNTVQIINVAKWLIDFYYQGHDTVKKDEYEHLLDKVDLDCLMRCGMKLVKQMNGNIYLEYPRKGLDWDTIDKTISLYNPKVNSTENDKENLNAINN